jgi:hypothetical protein
MCTVALSYKGKCKPPVLTIVSEPLLHGNSGIGKGSSLGSPGSPHLFFFKEFFDF